MGFVGIFELGVAVIECIQSSGWTGYVLMEVRDDLFEVSFVEVPSDDTCSVRMYPLSSSCSLDKATLVSACGGI